MSTRFWKSLENHKRRKEELSEGGNAMLKEAVLQLISYHHSFDKSLSETSSLLSNVDKRRNTSSNLSDGIKSKILIKLAAETSTDVTCTETCAFKVLEVAQQEKVGVLIQLVRDFMKNDDFSRPRFLNILCKDSCLPGMVLWQLHNTGVMTLDSYLKFKHQDSTFVNSMVSMLCTELSNQELTDSEKEKLEELTNCMSSLAFLNTSDTQSAAVKKVASNIIDATLRCLVDKLVNGSYFVQLPVTFTKSPGEQGTENMKKLGSHILTTIISHRPDIKACQALNQQKDWIYSKIPLGLLEWYKQILLVYDDEREVVQLLQQILEHQEVNWRLCLSFVSTYLVCIPQASVHVLELTESWLRHGLENSDADKILVGFLVARQACLEGSHVFMPYDDWFQKVFGDSKSLAGNKKMFSFLLKFLTDLVPYETPHHLKAHIRRLPFVPAKCRELLNDYVMLANTRLSDLKEPIDLTRTDDADKSKVNEQVELDIQQAVSTYQTTAKIPSSIMEASIFRRPYFVGRFLPVLLKPRPLPDMPDHRMKFIEALKKVEKIPPNMYEAYDNACKQEAARLLEGIFLEEDEDDISEMTMEPMEQLQHRLGQLEDIVLKVNGQGRNQPPQMKLTEMMSIIKEKLSIVLNVDMDYQKMSPAVLVVDTHCADLTPLHVQVVDCILNMVCHLSTACTQANHPDFSWVLNFGSLISDFSVLHKALVTRVWKLIFETGPKLEPHHIKGMAMMAFILSVNYNKFGDVVIKSFIDSQPSPAVFSQHLWRSIPLGSSSWMDFVLRFGTTYIQYVFSCVDDTQLKECCRMVLPESLVQKFEFLCCRLLPEVRGQTSSTGSDFRLTHVIYRSKKYKEYCESVKLTFEDWIKLELRMNPSQDHLSHSKRTEYYHWTVYQKYMNLSLEDGGCFRDIKQACSTLFRALVQWDMSSETRTVTSCGKCNNQNVQLENGSRAMFVHMLQEMVNYLPSSDSDNVWLLKQFSELCDSNQRENTETVTKHFIRLAVCLPSHLFFVDKYGDEVDPELTHSSCVINDNFRQTLCEGCCLPSDVTVYLIQGLVQCSKHTDVSLIFSKCPILTTSAMVHFHQTVHFLDHFVNDSSWSDKKIFSMYAYLKGCMNGKKDGEPPAKDWMLSACLLSLALNSCERQAKQLLREIISNKSLQCLQAFCRLLTAELTSREHLQQNKTSRVLHDLFLWLMTECPFLLVDEPTRQVFIADDVNALQYFTMLSALTSCEPTCFSDQLNSIIKMFVGVVKMFEERQEPTHARQVFAIQDIVKLAEYIKDCIKNSHPRQIALIDQDVIQECGTDIMLAINQRR